MRYLLDTSALLCHLRQEMGWEAVQALFEDETAELMLASVTVAELARRLRDLGASDSEVAELVAAYRLLFRDVIAINETIAWNAYEIGRQTPTRLPLIDAFIAAAAQTSRATLVHRDHHLASIPLEQGAQLYLELVDGEDLPAPDID